MGAGLVTFGDRSPTSTYVRGTHLHPQTHPHKKVTLALARTQTNSTVLSGRLQSYRADPSSRRDLLDLLYSQRTK